VIYRAILSPIARNELYDDAFWWSENRSADQAFLWLEGFQRAINSLAKNPERHPRSKESNDFPFELRQMLYGLRKKPTHRAVFEIRGQQPIVHGIRHLGRRDLSPDGLRE
jgi:hypothetical protein